MGRRKAAVSMSNTTAIRFPPDLQSILDAHLENLRAERPGWRVSVSDAVRDLMMRGWESLKKGKR